MEDKKNIEMNIADAIMEKPIGFNIGSRHFCLYHPCLGKTYLLSRLMHSINFSPDNLKTNPYLEAIRICRDFKDVVCRILSYHSFFRKTDILDETKIGKRAKLFGKNLDLDELAQLLIIVMSWDDVDVYIKHFGLDKERNLRNRISKMKSEGCSVSFGGLSTYGALIDFACQRYGWTMDYVVWGISYVNLQMLMADAITSIYLSKDEMKKLRIPQDRTYISGDDPRNIDKIKSMNWN